MKPLSDSELLIRCVAELTAISMIADGKSPVYVTDRDKLAEIRRRAYQLHAQIRAEHDRRAAAVQDEPGDDDDTADKA